MSSTSQVAGLILMTAAIIYGTEQAVEQDYEDGAFIDTGSTSAMKWHDAFYYTIVTLSTVG